MVYCTETTPDKSTIKCDQLAFEVLVQNWDDDLRGNLMGLVFEVLAGGVFEQLGKRVTARTEPLFASTTLYGERRHSHVSPAVTRQWFALHEVGYKGTI